MGQRITSASEAIKRLQEGNQRFTSGLRSIEAMTGILRLKELAENGQSPFAVILTCSDSRIPTELVFDQGLGDLFVIRVAGNVASASVVASVEFAVLNFGTPLCLVMGHTSCGAIHSTIAHETGQAKEDLGPNLANLLEHIRPTARRLIQAQKGKGRSESDLERELVSENVDHSVAMIQEKSTLLQGQIKAGRVAILGATYDLHTGRVDFRENGILRAAV